jgi:hypothetical protein
LNGERIIETGLVGEEGYAVSEGRWAENRDKICWVFCLGLTDSFGIGDGTGG